MKYKTHRITFEDGTFVDARIIKHHDGSFGYKLLWEGSVYQTQLQMYPGQKPVPVTQLHFRRK